MTNEERNQYYKVMMVLVAVATLLGMAIIMIFSHVDPVVYIENNYYSGIIANTCGCK